MSSDIARVRYFDRQYLRLDEFVDEQAYHLAAHRRHNVGLHRWGIVHGLRLVQDELGAPRVEPGFAVDGYGRDLVLDSPQPVATTAFDELGSEVVAVWLVYDRFGSDSPPAGYESCEKGAASASFYREQERPRLIVDVPDPDPTAFDPRRPETVPEGDREFPPWRDPPDDPRDDWPVFLGRITRDASNPAKPSYALDLKSRPYAGAVAASVEAPFEAAGSPAARLVLGGDEGLSEAEVQILVPVGDRLEPALEIDAERRLTTYGDLEVRGDLEIAGGALELAVAAVEEPQPDGGEQPETAQPWRLYRHRQATAVEGSEETLGEQLRIEMADGEPTEVVIGVFSADDGAFKPCLTVGADCSVTVHGNLVIEGDLIERSPRVAAKLSALAANLVLSSFQSGIAGTNVLLAGRPGFFGTTVAQPVLDLAAMRMAATAPTVAAETVAMETVAALAADPGALATFAGALRDRDAELASRLADLLAARPDDES